MGKKVKTILSAAMVLCILFTSLVPTFAAESDLARINEMKGILSNYLGSFIDFENVYCIDEQNTAYDHVSLQMDDGTTTRYTFSEPVVFEDENGALHGKEISISERKSSRALFSRTVNPYEYENGQNDYRLAFSSDPGYGVSVNYKTVNFILHPEISDSCLYEKNGAIEEAEDGTQFFAYRDFYGTGSELRFLPQLNGIKEEILLPEKPTNNEFTFYLESEMCTPILQEDGSISLVDNENGEAIQNFCAPFAKDSLCTEGVLDEHFTNDCKYTIEETAENKYKITISVSEEWLNSPTTAYPIIIDPVTGNLSNSMDLPIHTSRTTVGAHQDNNAVGTSQEYGTSRSLIKFNLPSDITSNATINSAYYWARELTARTSDMTIGAYQVNSAWDNNTLWSSQPSYINLALCKKNINGNSTDGGANKYWFKFDIKNAVSNWARGIANYGILLKSESENSATKSLRTFAQLEYSTSSFRPYTVINYTHDVTAPTITGVTGNPTEWTNEDVKLTINGASDPSGLNLLPYSFSSSKGEYNWQLGSSKTFSKNQVVYIYLRDRFGNIALRSTVTIDKIDKTAPSITAIDCTQENGSLVVKVSAADSASGIKDYSFDGGTTWQKENQKAFASPQSSLTIKVRDNAGNIETRTGISADYKDIYAPYEPSIYVVDGRIGIESNGDLVPDGNGGSVYSTGVASTQYKINDGEWKTTPFSSFLTEDIPTDIDCTVYARAVDAAGNVSSITTTVVPKKVGTYTEEHIDAHVSSGEAEFDLARRYNSAEREWSFSWNAHIEDLSTRYRKLTLPDGREYLFFHNGTEYITLPDASLTMQNGSVEIDSITYSFDEETGYLVNITDKNGNYIDFIRENNRLAIYTAEAMCYIEFADPDMRIPNYIMNTDSEQTVYSCSTEVQDPFEPEYNVMIDSVTDNTGIVLQNYEYDEYGLLVSNGSKEIIYDSAEYFVCEKMLNGSYINLSYDTDNNIFYTSDSRGSKTETVYDDRGNILSYKGESGNTSSYTYDSYDRLLTETSGGETTTYSYASDSYSAHISSIKYSDGTDESYSYNSNQTVKRYKDRDDKYTYFEYDAYGNMVTSAVLKDSYTGEAPAEYSYNPEIFDIAFCEYYPMGQLKKITADDYSVTYKYSGNNVSEAVSTQTNEDGSVATLEAHYKYDGADRPLDIYAEDGTETHYVYDGAGRILRETVDGETTRNFYDSKGRLVRIIDPEDYDSSLDGLDSSGAGIDNYADKTVGRHYEYADNGNLIKEINRYGKVTVYAYDSVGNVTDKWFDIYHFTLNKNGDILKAYINNELKLSYEYNARNQLVSVNYPNGDNARFEYVGDNLVREYRNSTTPSVEYSYTDGELSEKINHLNMTKTVYSEDGTVSVYSLDSNALIHSYKTTPREDENGYDVFSETVFGTEHITNWFENQDQFVLDVSSSLNLLYTNDEESGNLTSKKVTLQLGESTDELLTSSYMYGDEDKISGLQHTAGNSQYNFEYTYSGENLCTVKENGKPIFYTYDSNDQLTRVDDEDAGKTYIYTYDERGNILSKSEYEYTRDSAVTTRLLSQDTYEYSDSSWQDLLTMYNSEEIYYDYNGNPELIGDRFFAWENGRTLSCISDPEFDASYTYDENGIRNSKTVDGVTTYFTTVNGRITSQNDGTNQLYFRYDGNNELFGVQINGEEYIYVKNLQGDIIAILDTSGNIAAEYSYDAWGRTLSAEGEIAQLNPMRYRGYYQDSETGYYYLQSRYYSPEYGRFINGDAPEIIFAFGTSQNETNMFSYCQNSPVLLVDHEGYLGIVQIAVIIVVIATVLSVIIEGANAFLTFKGYYLARDMFNHGVFGGGKNLSQDSKNLMIKTLKNSPVFKQGIKNALRQVKGTVVKNLIVTINFTTGDLYYSIGKVDFKLNGTKKNGTWHLNITGGEKYNFDEIRSFSKLSFGNLANDLGWVMQRTGLMRVYEWNISFDYTC